MTIIKRAIILLTLILVSTVSTTRASDSAPHVPSIDDLLNVKSVGAAVIAPDGKWVAYTISNSDFKQDAFVTQVWLVEINTGRSCQLTRGDKSAGNPRWSPDRQWLAFTSNRVEDKNQIFVIQPE